MKADKDSKDLQVPSENSPVSTGQWKMGEIVGKDLLDGIEIMQYAQENLEKISQSRHKLEEEYLRRKMAEDTLWPNDLVQHADKDMLLAIINFKDYEMHIQVNLIGTWSEVKSIYNKKKKKYICTYKLERHEEKTKEGVSIWFTILEMTSPTAKKQEGT